MKKLLLIFLIISLITPAFSITKSESNKQMITATTIALAVGIGIVYISKFFQSHYSDYKKEQWRYIRYIADDAEKKLYQSLKTKKDIDLFIKKFWDIRDTDNNLGTNEFKEQFEIRLDYAKKRYKKGNGLNDRGRVYLIYGAPDEIRSDLNWNIPLNQIGNKNSSYRNITSIEIWLYYRPAIRDDTESYFYEIEPGITKFVFVDIGGFGELKQIYSTEENEKIDNRFIK